jgi:ABC-2 family transporter protein
MAAALMAEWTKLRSVRATRWSLIAIVGFTILMTAFFSAVGHTDADRPGEGDDDVVVNSLLGVYLGQVPVVAFAVLAITSEYATGMIRSTFAALPDRRVAIAAKTLVVASAVLAAGLVAAAGSFVLAQPLLRGNGFTEPAYPHVSIADGPVLRAVVGSAIFLAALAVIGVSIGVIVRSTAVAISVLLGLVLVPLIVAPTLPAAVGDWVTRLTPTAGLAIQQTRPDRDVAIGHWPGLAVTCAWAALTLALAIWLVRRRDT